MSTSSRIIEVQGRFDGLWDVRVRWVHEDGEHGLDEYPAMTGLEITTLLGDLAEPVPEGIDDPAPAAWRRSWCVQCDGWRISDFGCCRTCGSETREDDWRHTEPSLI